MADKVFLSIIRFGEYRKYYKTGRFNNESGCLSVINLICIKFASEYGLLSFLKHL